MKKKIITDEQARRRVAKGDVFLNLPNNVMEAIWHWIKTGEITDALPEHYKKMTSKDLDICKY